MADDKNEDLSRWAVEGGHPDGILGEITEKAAYYIPPPKPLPDDEFREFVLGLCDGRIFTSEHVQDHSVLGVVFMPLLLGLFKWHTDEEVKAFQDELGVFWEYLDKAGPRGINGYPIFTSVRFLCKSDWKRALTAYKAEMERRKNIELPPPV